MRNVFAVVLGLLLMAALSIANIALMWFSLGWTFAFSGTGPEASSGWCSGMLVGGAVAALSGGVVCRKVSVQQSSLPGIVLVLVAVGLAVSGLVMGNSVEAARLPAGKGVGELSFAEASEYAVSPRWFHYANFFIAPGCVWCGWKMGRRR